MFGIGSMELLVILVVALLVLGPKNLPKIAHTIGRAMGEFRRVSTEFQRTLLYPDILFANPFIMIIQTTTHPSYTIFRKGISIVHMTTDGILHLILYA